VGESEAGRGELRRGRLAALPRTGRAELAELAVERARVALAEPPVDRLDLLLQLLVLALEPVDLLLERRLLRRPVLRGRGAGGGEREQGREAGDRDSGTGRHEVSVAGENDEGAAR